MTSFVQVFVSYRRSCCVLAVVLVSRQLVVRLARRPMSCYYMNDSGVRQVVVVLLLVMAHVERTFWIVFVG